MNLKGLIFAIVSSQFVKLSQSAKRVDAHIRAQETLKIRRDETTLLHRRNEIPLDTAELFQLTEDESLEAERDSNDAAGTVTERLKETYKGIEVFDTIVTVRKTKDGQLTGEASGEIIQQIDEDLPDIEAMLTFEETLHIALMEEGDKEEDISNVIHKKEIYIDGENKARLVDILSYLIDGEKRPFYIIDLRNGEVLKHWQGLRNKKCRTSSYKAVGGNERTGKISYGERPYCLRSNVINGKCYLENKYVRVIDMKNENHTYNNDLETINFDCKAGYNDEVNGAYSPSTDAFFHGSVVGSMFKDWFDSKPLKDKIIIRVHYGTDVENAFWDGRSCALGDGSDYLYPLTSLDIIGHEIGHGVTEQASGLVYYGESGGVDEAFSDIIGEAAEEYLHASDFMMGHDVMKYEPYLREFKEPNKDKFSIINAKDMEKSMDPHYSSGIFRRVWYVVVTSGMPVRYAAAVFLHANRMFWHSTSSFYECSCGVLKAALDLGFNTIPFRKAFNDVGIQPCDVDKYVFTLSNNETRRDIRVSGMINPVFKFETPPWAENFIVNVESETKEEIIVTVTTGGWELESNDKSNVQLVKSGTYSLNIPDGSDKEFFIKVSIQKGNTLDEGFASISADITAGYTCKPGYVPDSAIAVVYKRNCRKKKISKNK